jgi:hypothetical protein
MQTLPQTTMTMPTTLTIATSVKKVHATQPSMLSTDGWTPGGALGQTAPTREPVRD